jgi:hypothetical protein
MSENATAAFRRALERDLKPLQAALAELDGLWGKGIGTNGAVDKRVLDELRRRNSGLKVQLGSLERLADGEVPE